MIEFSVPERELLARIAGVFAILDPLPDSVLRAAEDAALVLRPTRTWRRLELVRDNVMSARERSLGFGPGGLEVLVRRAGRGAVALRGSVESCAAPAVRRLVDRRAAAVWVRWPGGAERALVDPGGRFDLADVPSGPVCLAVTGKSAGMALTPWFVC
ncbi:MAG TPA: hypothetical protein VGN81_17530 [Pseudonocardiaceae bacterium]|jgi:hypothetical protein